MPLVTAGTLSPTKCEIFNTRPTRRAPGRTYLFGTHLSTAPDNSYQTDFSIKEWKRISPTFNLSSRSSVNMDRKHLFRRGSLGEGGVGVHPARYPNTLSPGLWTTSLHDQGSTKTL